VGPAAFRSERAGGSAFRGLPLTAASRSCAGCGRCVARDRRGARSARRPLRSSGRSRRPAWRPAPRAPLSLRPAPRRQPDRSESIVSRNSRRYVPQPREGWMSLRDLNITTLFAYLNEFGALEGHGRQALCARNSLRYPPHAHCRADGLGPERPRASISPESCLPGLAGTPGARRPLSDDFEAARHQRQRRPDRVASVGRAP